MSELLNIKTLEGFILEGSDDVSILDAALKSRVNFEYSCTNGQCGACKTTLLEGNVIELKMQTALSENDISNKKILTCCCAPVSDIVIDAVDLTALKKIEIKTLPARINKIETKTETVIKVTMRLPPAANLKFLEGQYIDVIGPQGTRRSYSIANSFNDHLITLFIRKVEGGALSQYWFNEAKENDLIRFEGPKGSFYFRELNKNIIFLATGTGIAPIKAMLDKLSESSEVLDNSVALTLYWGNRESEDFFWEPDYPTLNFRYVPVLSKTNVSWPGRIGHVQENMMNDAFDLNDSQVYACGSLNMIESAKALLVEKGLNEKYFYSDAFVSS